MLEDLANCDFWRGVLIGIVRPGSRQRGVDIEIAGPTGFPVRHPVGAFELRNSALGHEYDPGELIELGEAVERGLPRLGVQRRRQDGRKECCEERSHVNQTRRSQERSLLMKEFLTQRLDASRDLYLLALALGERGPHQFGRLIQEARLHFIYVIEEARVAGLDTLDIQNLLARQSIDPGDEMRPDLLERLDEMLRTRVYLR